MQWRFENDSGTLQGASFLGISSSRRCTGRGALKAMRIVGHYDYQTMAYIYTHLDQKMMYSMAEDMADVFRQVSSAARKG